MLINNQNPQLTYPHVLLFDWHGTLVDTLDAMYRAIEDMLPRLEELGLADRLAPEETANTAEDVKLIRYIRMFRRLRPENSGRAPGVAGRPFALDPILQNI